MPENEEHTGEGEQYGNTTRRGFLRAATVTGAAVAASAVSGVLSPEAEAQSRGKSSTLRMKSVVAQPSLFYYPGEELAADEIRVSVMGSGWGSG